MEGAPKEPGWIGVGGVVLDDTIESLQAERRELRETIAARDRLLVELARQVTTIRGRLGKLTREEVDRELKTTVAIASRPWAPKLPCEVCGAVMIQIRAEGSSGLVIEHPGGLQCRTR
jgi:hypothetical protein